MIQIGVTGLSILLASRVHSLAEWKNPGCPISLPALLSCVQRWRLNTNITNQPGKVCSTENSWCQEEFLGLQSPGLSEKWSAVCLGLSHWAALRLSTRDFQHDADAGWHCSGCNQEAYWLLRPQKKNWLFSEIDRGHHFLSHVFSTMTKPLATRPKKNFALAFGTWHQYCGVFVEH